MVHVVGVTRSGVASGNDGLSDAVSDTVTLGLPVGVEVGVGVELGVDVRDGLGRGDVGPATGVLFFASVRNGEVRGGCGFGFAVDFGDGVSEAGGLITSGGSEPGECGRSEMTTPLTASPLNASAATVRR